MSTWTSREARRGSSVRMRKTILANRPRRPDDEPRPGMNTIFIHDLRVETRIGVYDWEQHLRQTVRLDLEIECPSDAAFRSDHFADALDYSAVVSRLQALAADHPHKLMERFAEAIADVVLGEFRA